jgi:Zn-dependent M16 (insulinase) family peptidase
MLLEQTIRAKRLFNVDNKDDVELFRQFLITKAWGSSGCPFVLEHPYLGVPEMIKDKLLSKFLDVKI